MATRLSSWWCGGEEDRLPVGAFVAFAVAQQDEDAVGLLLAFARQRHAAADRQSVAQGAGGELDAGHVMAGMAEQQRAILGVVSSHSRGKKPRSASTA